jgi:hypothetical protein
MPKTLLCFISQKKNKKAKEAIENTWLKTLPEGYRVLWFYGKTSADDVVGRVGNEVTLDTEEYYENLPLKVYKMIEYVLEEEEFDYIQKVDDDIYVNFKMFDKLKITEADYIGELNAVKKGDVSTYHLSQSRAGGKGEPFVFKRNAYYMRGATYFLSKKACKKLRSSLAKIDIKKSYIFEDHMVGDALEEHKGIKVKNIKVKKDGVAFSIDFLGWRTWRHMLVYSHSVFYFHPLVPQKMMRMHKAYYVEILRNIGIFFFIRFFALLKTLGNKQKSYKR